MERSVLEKPFPAEVIKTRQGAHGQVSYVEAAHYVRRLNEAFGTKWGWTIVARELKDAEVLVLGQLEVDGTVKQAFGGSRITTKTGSKEPINLADDFKAAGTDSLKKACSLLGIGLDLYLSEPVSTPAQETGRRGHLRDASRDAPEPNRLTAKQLKAIYAIATAQGISDKDLQDDCKELYGVMPEYLSRRDASALIGKLSEK